MAMPSDAASSLVEHLACPRCDHPLVAAGPALRCGGCRVDYPVVEGIPCLFADPTYALGEWRLRYARELQGMRRELALLQEVLAPGAPAVLPATRQRVERLAVAREAALEELATVLGAFAGGSPAADGDAEAPGLATLIALRTRLPPTQDIMSYEANLFRDWAWGDEENARSRDAILPHLAAQDGTLVVLGSGAGRLAYDLHQASAMRTTLGLDVNPLLARVAMEASAGRPVRLHEFPLAPRRLQEVAIARRLCAPAPARPGLAFLLGDARRPPLLRERADAVVTPWLVDILDDDFAVQAARINGLLAPGGTWVVFGSLSFAGADPRARYSLEEVCALMERAGFDVTEAPGPRLPYLRSPASRHSRIEEVAVLVGRRARSVSRPARHEALPDWITGGRTPVPLTESFALQAASTRIHAFLMSMVDGRRSLADMAALMEEQRLMPRADAEAAIRGFLIKMYDESG